MKPDLRSQLTGELVDLLSVRLAMVMAPLLQAAADCGHGDLASYLEKFGMDIRGEVEWLLSRYEVNS